MQSGHQSNVGALQLGNHYCDEKYAIRRGGEGRREPTHLRVHILLEASLNFVVIRLESRNVYNVVIRKKSVKQIWGTNSSIPCGTTSGG